MRLIFGTLSRYKKHLSVAAMALVWNVVAMILPRNGISRSYSVTLAWMPPYSRIYNRHDLMLRRGGWETNNRNNFSTTAKMSQVVPTKFTTGSYSTTRTCLHEQSTSVSEVEATSYAATLCGDNLTSRSISTFGGIQYFNTDVDSRFRVLFVLGGPGTYTMIPA
jgi:hypothetical protein